MKRIYAYIFLALVIFSSGFAALTEYEKQQSLKNPLDPDAGCFGTGGSCSTVQFSQWGQFMGVSTATLGSIAFAIVALMWILYLTTNLSWAKHLFSLIFISHMGAALFALFFIYLQAFILKSWCKYCMVVDITAIVMAVAFIILRRKK